MLVVIVGDDSDIEGIVEVQNRAEFDALNKKYEEYQDVVARDAAERLAAAEKEAGGPLKMMKRVSLVRQSELPPFVKWAGLKLLEFELL